MAGRYFYGRRQGSWITPINEAGVAVLEKVREGDRVKVTISQPRNIAANSLWHVLGHRVAQAMRAGMGIPYADDDYAKGQIKIGVGLTRPVMTPLEYRAALGPTMPMPRSTSFGSMDQLQFGEFLTNVENYLRTDLLVRMPECDERTAIFDLLDPKKRKQWKMEEAE